MAVTLWKRCLCVGAIFCFANALWLFGDVFNMPGWINLFCISGLLAFYVWFNIRPCLANSMQLRLRAMIGGYEILVCCMQVILLEMIFCVLALIINQDGWLKLVVNLLVFMPILAILLINGFFRVLINSSRLRVMWRVLLLTCWWVPIFNLYIFWRVLKGVHDEYYFALARLELDVVHSENQDCKTRYPLLLVHGIFFRDWQHINYWGRVPQALLKCGATIFYGGQQSAAPIAASAAELQENLQKILKQTGMDKVNIIAHSKGGLDSRYVISKLGMAPYVASLTTINTPHRGCLFVQRLLALLPRKILGQIALRYNGLFRKLGDKNPDFRGGICALTTDYCRKFNEDVLDADGVYYQSVMSTMHSPKNAAFPLNITWRLVNKYDKQPNDGLVARESALWGTFLGEVAVKGKRGVSHGDMIDLLREDIPGFDVREFYIELVKKLKAKGL
ncbi:MAG: triacylglycerol lipase [Clostridiales bacterium]